MSLLGQRDRYEVIRPASALTARKP